jgi:hypothetical protein
MARYLSDVARENPEALHRMMQTPEFHQALAMRGAGAEPGILFSRGGFGALPSRLDMAHFPQAFENGVGLLRSHQDPYRALLFSHFWEA